MPVKLPPFVERNRVKGHTYLYFRIGKGQRLRLPNDPSSPEFAEAYKAALAGNFEARAPKLPTVAPGSIAALVRSYKASSSYQKLRDTTKTGYSGRLREIEDKHGHRSVAGLNPERVEKAFLLPNRDKPGKAHALLKMLRILVKHARKTGMLKTDPTIGLDRPALKEIRAWTEAEINQFEARWPIGSRERLAFALMLYTGQRRSDVHRMTWADLTTEGIRVLQQKTGAKLIIPVHRHLAEVLEAAPRVQVVMLSTAFGKPFTVAGFSQFMRDAIREAGLPLECQPHGLRKAAGRRLAEAECTPNQIMAVLGHKSLAEATRYTRDAEQARLALQAVSKMEKQGREQGGDKSAQTTPGPFGNGPKSARKST
jgi:enterobacteria phage integrase